MRFFGSELNHNDPDLVPGFLNFFYERILFHVESEQSRISTEGLFRQPGKKSEINSLISRIENLKRLKLKQYEIFTLCDTLKLYFNQMCPPLLPYEKVLEIAKDKNDDESKKHSLKFMIMDLPRNYRLVLNRLMNFLKAFSLFEDKTKMGSKNLSTVFSPNLFRPCGDVNMEYMMNMSHFNRFGQWLIEEYDYFFGDLGDELREEMHRLECLSKKLPPKPLPKLKKKSKLDEAKAHSGNVNPNQIEEKEIVELINEDLSSSPSEIVVASNVSEVVLRSPKRKLPPPPPPSVGSSSCAKKTRRPLMKPKRSLPSKPAPLNQKKLV